MQMFQDFLDRSKQLNQAPHQLKLEQLPFHAPNQKYKIIHQGLMIPNLPAPLHYLNFLSLIGQPNAPMLRNDSAIQTHPLDTATVLVSSSPHMVGQLSSYSVEKECYFKPALFQFGGREQLEGHFPEFRVQRLDSELSFDLKIRTTPVISYFAKLRMGLADHWSLLCECSGQLQYKQQHYQIQQLGSFEYARAINFPYLPLAFFTYQVINLQQQRQLLLAQVRDRFNRILQSRMYLRDLGSGQSQLFDEGVYFKVHRVYPAVMTPNRQSMYLPREFEWCYSGADGTRIHIQAQSRGDFKFGLAAGYVGSFHYQVKINDVEEQGEGGYCEYIDCRALKWQEKNQTEKLGDHLANPVPFLVKKEK